MKPRELRRKVLIGARMRTGASWGDVCLLNLSSRGVLAQAAVPPPKGTYIEVRRGSHLIVARVVWAEKHKFGLCTQDAIGIDAIIADTVGAKSRAPASQIEHQADRRSVARTRNAGERHERSRLMARAMEFCFLVGSGAMLASLAFSLVQQSVAAPMSQVRSALSPQ